MRPIWSGALSFGLINIPVRLYSATAEKRLNFRLLHDKDREPVRYVRVCAKDGKEVPWEHIVKGYEIQKGDFVVLTDADLKKANVRAAKTVDIQTFVHADEIDPIYFEKPYYLEPDKGAAHPYALLREALKRSRQVAVAKFVLREREHLGILAVKGDAIILEQMRFDSEVAKPDELNLPKKASVQKREVEMALRLIDQLSGRFDPKQYKDEYRDDLMKLIDAKARGKRPKAPARARAPRATRGPDIIAVLRKSLQQRHRPRRRTPQHYA